MIRSGEGDEEEDDNDNGDDNDFHPSVSRYRASEFTKKIHFLL